jgi:branched-chain amino acid transport system substrate-binding protein
MNFRSILAIILVFALVACTQTTTQTSTEKTPLIIGAIVPLTGDAAAYGEPIKQAEDLAVEEINAAGGINGRPLKIIYEDGACSPKGATTAAQKLISIDNVKVIIGGLCSGETLGAAPVAEAAKVILFSPGSGSPDVTNAGDYIFRNFPSDATSGSKVAKAAIANGHKKIVILSESTDYAQAVKRVFKETYEKEGGVVVADEMFASDSSDYRSQITKMKYANPDGIYLVAQTPAKYSIALKQLRESGLTQQLYTNEWAAAEDVLKERAKEIEGAVYAEPAFDENAPKTKEFLDKLRARNNGELSGALPPVYFATAYDAVYVLKEAMDVCGEDTDCIKTQLYSVKNREGTTGALTIDRNGDPEFAYVLKTIKNGQVVG